MHFFSDMSDLMHTNPVNINSTNMSDSLTWLGSFNQNMRKLRGYDARQIGRYYLHNGVIHAEVFICQVCLVARPHRIKDYENPL